jgi:hypothetical protein
MAEPKKAGGYTLAEPDFDPTSAGAPLESPAERVPHIEPVEQDKAGRVIEKKKVEPKKVEKAGPKK